MRHLVVDRSSKKVFNWNVSEDTAKVVKLHLFIFSPSGNNLAIESCPFFFEIVVWVQRLLYNLMLKRKFILDKILAFKVEDVNGHDDSSKFVVLCSCYEASEKLLLVVILSYGKLKKFEA